MSFRILPIELLMAIFGVFDCRRNFWTRFTGRGKLWARYSACYGASFHCGGSSVSACVHRSPRLKHEYSFHKKHTVSMCGRYALGSVGWSLLYAGWWQSAASESLLGGERGEVLREAAGSAFCVFLIVWVLTYTALQAPAAVLAPNWIAFSFRAVLLHLPSFVHRSRTSFNVSCSQNSFVSSYRRVHN